MSAVIVLSLALAVGLTTGWILTRKMR